VVRVLRSGCYLTHDVMAYAAAFRRIQDETTLTLPPGGLAPALEVWAWVQSRPDPDKAILTMGKRDVGWDAGLPRPLSWHREGMEAPQPMPPGHEVQALNDQHCHMAVPEGSPLAVGDMVGFGIGHPCTTFDRWHMLMLVDETYRVTGAIRTFF
jgi:D-serine dehydratase